MNGRWSNALQKYAVQILKSLQRNVDYTVRDADYHLEYIN